MKSVATERLASITNTSSSHVHADDRSPFFTTGFLTALLANVLWGTSFLASKATLASWGPFTAASLRFALATVFMFIGLRIFKRDLSLPRNKREWGWVFAIATLGFGFLYPLQLSGLREISSGLSAAIMLTSPLFVLLASHLFLRDKVTSRKVVAILLGMVGGILLLSESGQITSHTKSFLSGAVLTVLASASLAGSVVATKKLNGRLDAWSLTFWTMAIGFIEITISAFVFEENDLARVIEKSTTSSILSLIYLALVCSAFCFFLWNYSINKATPKEIASTMHIKTPAAVVIGVFAAGEILTGEIIIGTAIVMLAVFLSQLQRKETSK